MPIWKVRVFSAWTWPMRKNDIALLVEKGRHGIVVERSGGRLMDVAPAALRSLPGDRVHAVEQHTSRLVWKMPWRMPSGTPLTIGTRSCRPPRRRGWSNFARFRQQQVAVLITDPTMSQDAEEPRTPSVLAAAFWR